MHEVHEQSACEELEERVAERLVMLHHLVELLLLDAERHQPRLGAHVGLTLPLVEETAFADDVTLAEADLGAAAHRDARDAVDDCVERERGLVAHHHHRARNELDELRGVGEIEQRLARQAREETERRHRTEAIDRRLRGHRKVVGRRGERDVPGDVLVVGLLDGDDVDAVDALGLDVLEEDVEARRIVECP